MRLQPFHVVVVGLASLPLAACGGGGGDHLWAETYDRPATDVFGMQVDIAKRATQALSIALAGNGGPGPVGNTNVAAHDAYLRGKQVVIGARPGFCRNASRCSRRSWRSTRISRALGSNSLAPTFELRSAPTGEKP